MRVLFAVSGWAGHWFPMVPLGWALQAAGHEVRVACQPGEAQSLTRAGLTPVPVLDGMDMVFLTRLRYLWDAQAGNWPYPWRPLHPVTGTEVAALDEFDFDAYVSANTGRTFGALARSFAAAADLAGRWRPDLVVHDPLSTEGALAARVAGVPAVVHLWGTTGTHEPAGHGLSIVPTYPPGTFARWKVRDLGPDTVRHVIDPCPARLAPPVGSAETIPVRYVPYNGPGEMPDWLHAEPARPRVAVVWGTSVTVMSGPRSYALPRIVEALAGLDVEVVVTATAADAAALGPLPPLVRVLERFPLRLLLPTCAAVVHHGGAGCVMTALAAGVPQVSVTYAIEQALAGTRIAAAGAGATLPGHLADVPAIRAAVADLLAKPGYGQAATVLRDELDQRPTPAALVDRLCRLAGR
jgi:UDP:flavonoid glycosyltransferase YjiC (YdhE family)